MDDSPDGEYHFHYFLTFTELYLSFTLTTVIDGTLFYMWYLKTDSGTEISLGILHSHCFKSHLSMLYLAFVHIWLCLCH